jgi:hypothetical protein
VSCLLKEIKKRVVTFTGDLESMEENDRCVQGYVRKEVKEIYQSRFVNVIRAYFYLRIIIRM